MTEKIQVDIEANDDASDKLDDVADKVEAVDGETAEVEVTADTGAADADLEAVSDAVTALSKADAEVVVRAKIDAAKADLKELRNELDGLTGPTSPAHGVAADIDEINESTGKARDTMTGFVGNAVSEIPGIGDAFGPAGEAAGQLTEGLLSGDVALGGLIATGAGIAILTLAIKTFNEEQEKIKRIDAFKRDRVDDFADGLRDATSEAEALRKALAPDEKIEYIDFSSLDAPVRDATENLVNLGLTADKFFELVKGGRPAVEEWVQQNKDSGLAVEDLRVLVAAAEQGTKAYKDGLDAAADRTYFFGQKTAETGPLVDAMGHQMGAAAGEAARLGSETHEASKDVDDLKYSYDKLYGRLNEKDAFQNVVDSFADAKKAAEDAYFAAITGADDYKEKQAIAEQKTRDQERALLDYAAAFDEIPDSVATEIVAEIDRGHADDVLWDLTKDRNVRIIAEIVKAGVGQFSGSSAADALNAAQNNITVNLPTGSSGVDVLRATTNENGRSGVRYIGG